MSYCQKLSRFCSAHILHLNRIGDNIRLVEGYVPDQEVEKYFAAADLVVAQIYSQYYHVRTPSHSSTRRRAAYSPTN